MLLSLGRDVRSSFSVLHYYRRYRFPRYDDQAIFWTIIREIQHPPVLHIQRCRDYGRSSQESLQHPNSSERYLVTCMLHDCLFSAGMISHMASYGNLHYYSTPQTIFFFSFLNGIF